MILFKQPSEISAYLSQAKSKGKTIGFVPTMGALHAGHMSLISESLSTADLTVVSIFVNPTQFNDPNDFKKYPVTIEQDITMLLEARIDVLFLPPVEAMYPNGLKGSAGIQLGRLEDLLEGKFRPGHFQGVCQVMDRLLNIVSADNLFMGRKDYQQCMVVNLLLSEKNYPAQLNVVATLREPDGLAMSSRNLRLNKEERALAPHIYQALRSLQTNLAPGDISVLVSAANTELSQKGFRIDYLEIVSAGNLENVQIWDGQEPVVAIVAAFLNDVRLIDNLEVNH